MVKHNSVVFRDGDGALQVKFYKNSIKLGFSESAGDIG